MENIPRDVDKKMNMKDLPKTEKRGIQRTMLFVGDDGEVMTVKQHRSFHRFLVLLCIVSLIACGAMYYFYRNIYLDNKKLVNDLTRAHRHIKALEKDKNVLLARLIVAQEEAGIDTPIELEATKIPEMESDISAELESEEVVVEDEIPESDDEAAPMGWMEAEPTTDSPVAAENLIVTYNKNNKTYRAEYDIRNVSSQTDRISGKTYVALSSDQTELSDWLILPSSRNNTDPPSGESFSISNFKHFTFSLKNRLKPDQFTTATIFVHQEDGNLVFKKAFPITLQ